MAVIKLEVLLVVGPEIKLDMYVKFKEGHMEGRGRPCKVNRIATAELEK
jgi:hypothetical protein